MTDFSDGVKYTVCGEWFPGTYPAFRSKKWSRGDEDPLDTEMRLFCACERWAFNRLLDGRSREELKQEGQQVFGLNSRYSDDAILKAKEIIGSQQELLPGEIEETETKLARAKKKYGWAEKDLAQALVAGEAEKIARAKLTVHGRKARVKKLENKLAELWEHKARGTIPKVVFGGRSLWKRVGKGKATREEWRNARQNRLYARGDATKGGNPNMKIGYSNGAFTLSVTISHLSVPTGVDSLGRPVMARAPRVAGKLWLPEKHRLKVWELLLSGAPYAVELIRGKDGRYRAHITFSIAVPETVTNPNRGYLGMDTNPDGVALANVSFTGQAEPWPEGFAVPYPKALPPSAVYDQPCDSSSRSPAPISPHKFAGEFQVAVQPNGFLYIKLPELAYSRGYRRTYLTGVLAKVVVEVAKALGKPLAVERLDFGKDRLGTEKKFNRMAANFPFKKMIEAVMRKAFKEGVAVRTVWPAHTSTIGYWKYGQRYGLINHHAAALTIARRAMGFKERITKELKQKIQAVKEKLQKANSLPGEGKGMTRKVKRQIKGLDEKVSVHNGLDRYKQESLNSVWSDLKRLALASR